jgi:hypothetical protein
MAEMDKVVLLKTQLSEAASFARSKQLGHKRLAVILLDNFVEIQLSGMISQKFSWDGLYYFQDRKYSVDRRVKILNHYDELLTSCVEEGIISSDERRLLAYCHGVRNNLYHKVDEETLLIQIAIIILSAIIVKHQPTWKSGRSFTQWSVHTFDPFNPRVKSRPLTPGNSEEDWRVFIKKYFCCIDGRAKSGSKLLSDFLIRKIQGVKDVIKYIGGEFGIYFPIAKEWEYNDFLLHYSFRNIQRREIERIKEIKNVTERGRKYDDLFSLYKRNWRYRRITRLDALEASFKKLAKVPIEKGIEKFASFRDEVKMIYEAFQSAAADFDSAVDEAVDRARST